MPIEDADNENPRAEIDLSDIFCVRHSAHVFFFRRSFDNQALFNFGGIFEKYARKK